MNRRSLLLGLIFALSLVTRLALMPDSAVPTPGSDEDEYDSYALNMAQGRGYRGPSPAYSDRDHLTSWRMPGTSLLFAAIYSIAGHRPLLAALANTALSGATAVTLVFIAERIYGYAVGLITGFVYALWPHAVYLSTMLSSEPLYVFLLMLFVLQVFRLATSVNATNIVLAGLLLGGALYVRPHVFILPFVVLWIVVAFWPNLKLVSAVSMLLVVAAVMFIPWIVRNAYVQGAFVPFTTQGGEALLLGANRIVATEPKYYGFALGDARLIPEYKHEFDGLNEVQRSARALELYKEWMLNNPDKWWYLLHSKFRRFWTPFLQQPSLANRLIMLFSWGPVLLAFVAPFGHSFLRFLSHRDPRIIVHFVVLSTLLNSLIFSALPRYRFPIEGLCIVFAAAAVVGCVRVIIRRGRQGLRAAAKEFLAPQLVENPAKATHG
jgi:4-amino-4-deoxy-L-arabinose transferase-like glycosyltransferase